MTGARQSANGHQRRLPLAVALAMLLGLGVLWGGTMPLARFAVTQGFPPVAYSFWAVLGGGLLVTALAIIRGTPPRLTWRYQGFALVTGIVQFAIPNAVMYTALQHITAGTSVLIVANTSMIAYVASMLAGWEGFRPIRFAGILLGLAGVAVIFVPRIGAGATDAGWIALGLITPACYAIGNLMLGHFRPKGAETVPLVGSLMLGGALFLVPVMWATDSFAAVWPPFAPAEIASFATMTITAFAFVGLTEMIRLTGPVFASQMVYLMTTFGVLYGIVFLGEPFSLALMLAGALILAGIALVHRH